MNKNAIMRDNKNVLYKMNAFLFYYKPMIYIYIYSEWSNYVAISVYCKSLHIWIEVSVAVKRMYVINSNCDS